MKIGENGIYVFKMYDLDMSVIDKIIFTFSGVEKIEKVYPSESVNYSDNRFYIGLIQEDTVILSRNRRTKVQVEAQVCFKNGTVVKTDITSFVLGETLNTTIIPGNSPSDFVNDIEFHYENGIIIIGGSGLTEERVRQIIAGYNFATETELEDYVTLSDLDNAITEYVNAHINEFKGAPGEDGKSAYEAAVEAGYEGSEAEFGEGLANIVEASSETVENIDFGSEVVIDAN